MGSGRSSWSRRRRFGGALLAQTGETDGAFGAHAGRLGGGTDPPAAPGRRFVRPGIAGGGSVSVAEKPSWTGRSAASTPRRTPPPSAGSPSTPIPVRCGPRPTSKSDGNSFASWSCAWKSFRDDRAWGASTRLVSRMDFTPWRRGTTSSAMTWAAPTAPLHARFGRPVSQSAWGTPPRRGEPVGAGVGNVGAGQRVPVA